LRFPLRFFRAFLSAFFAPFSLFFAPFLRFFALLSVFAPSSPLSATSSLCALQASVALQYVAANVLRQWEGGGDFEAVLRQAQASGSVHLKNAKAQ
jgi:hypothetical protein